MTYKKPLLKFLFVICIVFLSGSAVAGRYDGLVKQLDDYMGGGASIKRADENKFVAVGNNGNQFRMDLDGHGYKPHAHLETPNLNTGKPMDAPGTPHHITFDGNK